LQPCRKEQGWQEKEEVAKEESKVETETETEEPKQMQVNVGEVSVGVGRFGWCKQLTLRWKDNLFVMKHRVQCQ